MDAFIKVIRKDPKVRIKINDMLDRYKRISPEYQSRIVYNTFIQNVIPKELINILGTPITDLDKELKTKIIRMKYLEDRLLYIK